MSAAVDMGEKQGDPYRDPRADALRLRYYGVYSGDELPVPVEKIAGDLVGLDVRQDNELHVSGMLLPASRTVWLNALEPEPRRRFTLAHELGHWVCQCLEGNVTPVMCRPKDVSAAADRALEREANIFAAELLMPEPTVRAVWREIGNVELSAARFHVSENAMRWRLYSFGLLDSPPQ